MSESGRPVTPLLNYFGEDYPPHPVHPVDPVKTSSSVSSVHSVVNSPSLSPIEKARKENPRAYEKWSEEEDTRLRQTWEQENGSEETTAGRIRAIAADFARKPGAIRSRLKKLGLISSSQGAGQSIVKGLSGAPSAQPISSLLVRPATLYFAPVQRDAQTSGAINSFG